MMMRRDDDDDSTTVAGRTGSALRNVGDQLLVAAAIVFAIATDVASLAAHVARLDRVGAVARDVSRFVAVVARHVLSALRLRRTVAGEVAALVAHVADGLLWGQAAVARNVAGLLAPVATVALLLALARKVAELVAFVALLLVAATRSLVTAERRWSTRPAVPRNMARALAFVAGRS